MEVEILSPAKKCIERFTQGIAISKEPKSNLFNIYKKILAKFIKWQSFFCIITGDTFHNQSIVAKKSSTTINNESLNKHECHTLCHSLKCLLLGPQILSFPCGSNHIPIREIREFVC